MSMRGIGDLSGTANGGRNPSGAALWPAIATVVIVVLGFAVAALAAFNEIDGGARAIALGGAYTAIADDVNTVFYNPAGLIQVDALAAGMMRASKFSLPGYWVDLLAAGGRISENAALGAFVARESAQLEENSEGGNSTNTFSESRFGVGAAWRPAPRVALGATIQALNLSTAEGSVWGWGGDAGAYFRPPRVEKLAVGASLEYVASSFGAQGPRLTGRTGMAYNITPALIAAADLVSMPDPQNPSYRKTELRGGIEYTPQRWLTLRAGWRPSRVSGGFSLQFGAWTADYAVTVHELGFSHYAGLRVRLIQ